MAQQKSDSYLQLKQIHDAYDLDMRADTEIVLWGDPVAVQWELAELITVATSFDVLVTTLYDDVEETALAVLSGSAYNMGKLAAHMEEAQEAAADAS